MKKDYESLTKPPLYFLQLFPVFGDYTLYFQPFEHRILTYSFTAFESRSSYTNDPPLFQSEFSHLTLHKNMFFSIINNNNLEYLFQSFIQYLTQNLLHHQLTLIKGLIGNAQQDISLIAFAFQTTIIVLMNAQN